jgi:hypothetical protein
VCSLDAAREVGGGPACHLRGDFRLRVASSPRPERQLGRKPGVSNPSSSLYLATRLAPIGTYRGLGCLS